MKNFWLQRRGPKKHKINIWLGSSITGGEEELIGSMNTAAGAQHERLFIAHTLECDDPREVSEVSIFGTNARMVIPLEIDQMLWDLRIGKAIVQRDELGLFNGKPVPHKVMKAQWQIPEGCRMWKQGSYQKITNNNGKPEDDRYSVESTFCIKEENPDPRTQGSCPKVLGTQANILYNEARK